MRQSSKTRLTFGLLAYLLSAGAVVLLLILTGGAPWVRMALAIGALVMTLAFMTTYHLGTRGAWRRSDIGVHLMVFGLANGIILAFVVLAFLGALPMAVLPYFSALTYLTVGWLFGWRTVIMDGYLRGGPDEPDSEDVDDSEDYRNGYPPRA